MRRILKWLFRSLMGVVVLVGLLIGAAILWTYRALPDVEGDVVIAIGGGVPSRTGSVRPAVPAAPISIIRDRWGIPTIEAQSEADALFALGWVHAQDRLWQMEAMRRMGSGEMAALVGSPALPLDRFIRTLGLRHLAQETYRRLPDGPRQALEAYADGVNAWLDHPDRPPLPPEFQLLMLDPDPWHPVDSLLWQRIMGLLLAGDWRQELIRSALIDQIGLDRTAMLMMEDDDAARWERHDPGTGEQSLQRMEHSMREDDTPVQSGTATPALSVDQSVRLLNAIPDGALPRLASNAWAVDGGKSATGAPLLAGDPHLGLQAPTQWYLARIEYPGGLLVGATHPGVPLLVMGHNGHIAWSLTTTHADSMDLVIEKPINEWEYETEAGPKSFIERQEVLSVRFGEDENLTVRTTRNGPVVSDVLPFVNPSLVASALPAPSGAQQPAPVLSLRSAALTVDDSTASALYAVNKARNWSDFVTALQGFHSPVQNFTYADTEGSIGLITAGRLPLRPESLATLPTAGWLGEGQWTGWVPFAELPRIVSPASGMVMNTNNRVHSDDYQHFLTTRFPGTWRAERLERLLMHKDDHTLDDMGIYQNDSLSEAVATLLPVLIAQAERQPPPAGSPAEQALTLLKNWRIKGDMDAKRPEPLLATAWLRTLTTAIVADELGPVAPLKSGIDPAFLHRVLRAPPGSMARLWCDRQDTNGTIEDCPYIVSDSLAQAVADLDALAGSDPLTVSWGSQHTAEFAHTLFGFIPGLRPLTSLKTETSGDNFTLNRGTWGGRDGGYGQRHGAGMRALYDLSNLDRSEFILATGQSGNPLSPHYGDMLPLWAAGRTIRIVRPGPEEDHTVLTLIPRA